MRTRVAFFKGHRVERCLHIWGRLEREIRADVTPGLRSFAGRYRHGMRGMLIGAVEPEGVATTSRRSVQQIRLG